MNVYSGKTLTFSLPVIQQLKQQELDGYQRLPSRPRCLILVPTRDLAKQVLSCVKKLSHHIKLSSGSLLGGEDAGPQKRMLQGQVDLLVASPGRLLQHKDQGHVFLGHVTHVIIDEVDTMLTQGFGSDIRAILQSVVLHPNKTEAADRRLTAYTPSSHHDSDGPKPIDSERVVLDISAEDSPISKVQVR